jgi:GH15 family glucan-1,4-alpha-glucosidase
MPGRIEDYAIVGNCATAALVGRDGSIDWVCLPRFDSAACFAALLGEEKHGRWLIAPEDEIIKTSRRYRGDTLVLETCFDTATGSVCIVDFMTRRDGASDIVRIVQGIRGSVRMRTELIVRFDYGSIIPWVSRQDDGRLRFIGGPEQLLLDTTIDLRGEDMKTVGEFEIGAGEEISFTLTRTKSYRSSPAKSDPGDALADTEKFWSDWVGGLKPLGRWSAEILRSLITLKALAHWETGGIVAAATTSLPEEIGGPRNWDYRFCWLRDATLTLFALMGGGCLGEATTWREWLLRAVAGSPDDLQIMYGLGGERRLDEYEIPWLPGYNGSLPVRIGNAAAGQVQLDVYGEVVGALYLARKAGIPADEADWALECAMIEHLESIWSEPDDGIWEVRGGRRHFTHSKVMAWLAFDRAIRSAEEFDLEAPLDRWREIRDAIHAQVCEKGFDAKRNSFVQSYGATIVDASLLMIPLVGFLPPSDPRIAGTVAAVEADLIRDGLVIRYDTGMANDGLPPGEGAFLACSFWLVANYAMLGRQDEAHALFERLLGLRNDVGLLAEEYDPVAKRQLGNFPQAFSHLALINSAYWLMDAGQSSELNPIELRVTR